MLSVGHTGPGRCHADEFDADEITVEF